MRWSSALKSRWPSLKITISPSRTNCFAGSARSASTNSGKYRPSGCPAFDWIRTLSSLRNATPRNPSHFGSYSHFPESGNCEAVRASIGGNGGWIGRSIGGKRSEEHTSELQSRRDLVCRLLLEKKKKE